MKHCMVISWVGGSALMQHNESTVTYQQNGRREDESIGPLRRIVMLKLVRVDLDDSQASAVSSLR